MTCYMFRPQKVILRHVSSNDPNALRTNHIFFMFLLCVMFWCAAICCLVCVYWALLCIIYIFYLALQPNFGPWPPP
jgi:hypothetical protein